MKLKVLLSLSVILLLGSIAFAISVDRTVLLPRVPDRYVRSVNAAVNTKTGQTLIVWETHDGRDQADRTAWGQFLEPDGRPTGNPFKILSSGFDPGGGSDFIRLIYNPDTNQFVFVYTKNQFGEFSEIYAIRLKPTGRKKGKPVLISHPHNPAFAIYNNRPSIFYDAENKGTIIFWHRYVEGSPAPSDPKGIYGVILNSNLSLRKKPTFIQDIETGPDSTFGPFISSIAFHKPSGKLLLGETLQTPVNFRSECLLTQIDPTLKTPAAVLKINDELQSSFCGVRLMQLPNGKIISLFSRDDGTKKRKVDSSGAPTGAESKFFAEPVRNVSLGFSGPAFASSSISSEFGILGFIGSEIETAQFWLQRANSKGKAVGPAIEIESGVDSVHGGIISALPFVPSGGHLYAVLYIEGERDQPPLVNQGSGLVLLRVNTAP